MKKATYFQLMMVFLMAIPIQLKSQVFCEGYGNSTGWSIVGGTNPFPAPTCSVTNFGTITHTAGMMKFDKFRTRQTTAKIKDVGATTIPGNSSFRVEMDYRFTNPGNNKSSPLLVLALTQFQTPIRVYPAVGNVPIETNSSTIEIRIGNTLNTNNNFRFYAGSKLGNVRGAYSANINIPNGTQYNTVFFLRLERLAPSYVELSVFLDPSRTVLLGSTCFSIDPGIQDLRYIQHGGIAGAGCSNITNAFIDELCIYNTVLGSACASCVVPSMGLTLSSTFNCTANSGSVTANPTGASPFTYNWSNLSTNQTISPVPAGTYSVTVTDVNGCSSVMSTSIAPAILGGTFQNTFNCNMGTGTSTVNPTGVASPYAYLWSNSSTNQTITSAAAGMYTVTVSDANGCTGVFTTTLAQPTITATFQVTPTCAGLCTGTLTISNTAGGTPAYLYSLDNSSFTSQTYYAGLCAGPHQVEIMDANGCRAVFNGNIPLTTDDWPKHPESNGNEYSQGNGIDVKSEKYLTGQFYERIKFQNVGSSYSPIVLTSTSGSNEDAYVVKYDDCGAAWAFGFGSVNNQDEGVVVRSIYDYPNGDIIVGANIFGVLPNGIVDATNTSITTTTNGIDLTTDPMPGVSKGLIISVDGSNGAVNWVYMIDNNVNHPTEINDLRIGDTSIFAIGNAFGSTFELGTDNFFLQGGWDIFLMKLGFNGVYISGNATTWGTAGDDNGEALDISDLTSPSPNLYTTGFVSFQQVTVQTNTYTGTTSMNGSDMFVGEFSITNLGLMNFQAHRSIGNDEGRDITAPGKSAVGIGFIVTGYFEDQLNLISASASTVTHNGNGMGNRDVFVAAFDDLFDYVWSREAVGNFDDVGEAICYNETMNSVFVAGEYTENANDFLGGTFTSNPSDVEIFIQEFDASSGFSLMQTTQQGDGDQDRAFDIELNDSELYTAGQFGNYGMLQFPTASNAPLMAMSNVHETYFARLAYSGIFFRPKEIIADEVKIDKDLIVYPNPFNDLFTISAHSSEVSSVQIMDTHGKLVYRLDNLLPGEFKKEIDLSYFPTGIYFIRFANSSEVKITKIVKQ